MLTTKLSTSRRSLSFGAFEFDPQSGELRKHGLRIKLKGQPIDLLATLLEHPGEVVTREELQNRIWAANTYVDFEHSLNAAIKRLRAALGDSAQTPLFVETVARRGYRFIAPLNRPLEEIAQVIPQDPEPAAPRRSVTVIAVVAAFVLLAIVSIILTVVRDKFWNRAPSDGFPVSLTAYPGSEWSAAFSPDNRQVAFAWNGVNQNNYDIYLKTSSSESPIRLTTDPAADVSPAWSPDGRLTVAGSLFCVASADVMSA